MPDLFYIFWNLLFVAHALSSYAVWAWKCTGSVVAVHEPSCPGACGSLVPWPGIEPMSLVLQDGFLATGPPESPSLQILKQN